MHVISFPPPLFLSVRFLIRVTLTFYSPACSYFSSSLLYHVRLYLLYLYLYRFSFSFFVHSNLNLSVILCFLHCLCFHLVSLRGSFLILCGSFSEFCQLQSHWLSTPPCVHTSVHFNQSLRKLLNIVATSFFSAR